MSLNRISETKPRILVHTLRAYQDNYCYLVQREGSKLAACVDACEAAPIERELENLGVGLGAILTTHHHHDHVGGNLELQKKWDCPIYCSDLDFERVPGATRSFKNGEFFVFDEMDFEVLEIPGHTQGQIAYLSVDAMALFVGDTVFEMGCGRLFEGTPEQMFATLQKIQALPADTQIFVGHEYTETNARFAALQDPLNADISKRLAAVRQEIAANGFAKPPTIAVEQSVNPFFRAKTADEFARLRKLRDEF